MSSNEAMQDTGFDEAMQQSDLNALKARATLLGIQFHPSIGAEKLREKISAAMADVPATSATPDPISTVTPTAPVAAVETEAQRRKRKKEEASRLIRIRLTCMNPAKKDWDGEIFTIGNDLVGTLKKYVPFTAEDGWHVPYMMYQHLKDRMCQVFTTVKTQNGVSIRKGKLIKEFAIEELPPLTQKELHELAQRQAMAQGQTQD